MLSSFTTLRENRGLAVTTTTLALAGSIVYLLWLKPVRLARAKLRRPEPVQKRAANDIDVPSAP